MDINDMRSIGTVMGFLAFLGIVFWAYGKGSKAGFDEAARLPLDDEETPSGMVRKQSGRVE